MDLPLVLLELIFQRLSLMDNLMNCRATCRSWQKAADAVFTTKLPLMLSLTPCKTPPASFCSRIVMLNGPNFATLSAPWSNDDDESSTVLTETWPHAIDSTDIIRVHSVQGWLIFNKFHRETFSDLSFFNPFSRARFKRPNLLLFSRNPRHYQVNLVFNSAPPGSEEFVVVFLCVFRYNVDDDDKLYGLTFKHNTSVVFVLNLRDHRHERLVMLNTIKDTYVGKNILTDAYYKPRHQLAMDTSTGELFLVLQENDASAVDEYFESRRTKGFRVYKLERSSLRWCEVLDIGDRFLLWDYTRVSFVSAKGLTLPDKFKGGNCIFFCHANTYSFFRHQVRDGGKGRFRFEDHDMGIFFLGDRTITHFPISSLPFSYQNMWFTPAPTLT
ncbi:hypothetical protein PIB30_050470 [Stylosanthes scabra]|uniref:F-box domain-containing protein n=1 Tax=Stylosanthes scabra TaxID=79078 RepID=A0ABU6WG08_9FABA|nr:hypothetical protein [Stylosanthes scabra]